MNQDPTSTRDSYRQVVRIGAFSILILAGCTQVDEMPEEGRNTTEAITEVVIEQSTQELQVTLETPKPDVTNETYISAQDCSFRAVQPGEYFNTQNSNRVAEQLNLLEVLASGTETIRLTDVRTAGSIMLDSRRDPLYAHAIVMTNDEIIDGSPISVESFLELPVDSPTLCDARHISNDDSRAQLQRTISISDYVAREMTKMLSNQGSDTLSSAFNFIVDEYELYKDTREQELNNIQN